ncbi:RagB/SusD family nutrient uptake outer membrane protein [Sphingobacterium siyangense]|uniref:RagB/SusD family nutrient uptake outer membrane protein n=1 Tax=Sphingobacterium siyangense TaxID=459529 RepID=UPI002FDEC488
MARDFLPGETTKIPNFVLTDRLLGDFEPDDKRRDAWVGSISYGGKNYSYPYKYQQNGSSSNTSDRIEYDVVLRLTEQYLIRAEARIHMGLLDDAKDDLNEIRKRAEVDPIQVSDAKTMLEQVAHERRIELFCEWGHRWFDLKRTNKTTEVLGPVKPAWKTTSVLFPVPQQAINTNKNLLPQNEGYN